MPRISPSAGRPRPARRARLASPRACVAALRCRPERGDVPGWVMITVMTAGLVAVLWQFAGPYLQGVLQSALEQTVGG